MVVIIPTEFRARCLCITNYFRIFAQEIARKPYLPLGRLISQSLILAQEWGLILRSYFIFTSFLVLWYLVVFIVPQNDGTDIYICCCNS